MLPTTIRPDHDRIVRGQRIARIARSACATTAVALVVLALVARFGRAAFPGATTGLSASASQQQMGSERAAADVVDASAQSPSAILYGWHSYKEAMRRNKQLIYTQPDGSNVMVTCTSSDPHLSCHGPEVTDAHHVGPVDVLVGRYSPACTRRIGDGPYMMDSGCARHDWYDRRGAKARSYVQNDAWTFRAAP